MNIRKLPVQVTIPLVCLSLLGCEMQGDISDEIATDTMYADLHVTLTQGKSVAVVEVQLLYQEPENKQYIILGDQDRFVATIDKLYSEANYANNLFDNLNYSLETNRVLTEHLSNSWTTVASSFSALSPIYSTSFDNASTDTVYRISFERDTGADAPASYILMPSPVSITSPLSGGTHDPRAELLVQWNEAIENETVEVVVQLVCTHSQFVVKEWRKKADESEVLLAQMSIPKLDQIVSVEDLRKLQDTGDCGTQLIVDRSVQGLLDSHFYGGMASGHYQDSVHLNWDLEPDPVLSETP